MKTLEDTRELLRNMHYNLTMRIYENEQADPDYDSTEAKENLDMLTIAFKVVDEKLQAENATKGDRLDRLLDKLDDTGCRTLYASACVCVALSTMEDHLLSMNEYDAAGRCNKMLHKYFGDE